MIYTCNQSVFSIYHNEVSSQGISSQCEALTTLKKSFDTFDKLKWYILCQCLRYAQTDHPKVCLSHFLIYLEVIASLLNAHIWVWQIIVNKFLLQVNESVGKCEKYCIRQLHKTKIMFCGKSLSLWFS